MKEKVTAGKKEFSNSESVRLNPQLRRAITKAQHAIITDQNKDGYWCYELEADCTIPAEYIMMMHFMDEIDEDLQEKMAVYLRRRQNDEGGWPLFYGGHTDLSCTVKVYYALKMAGDDIHEPHMKKAREKILSMGGAAKANVFTRIALALFEQIPWRGVPFIPVEIMTFPRWFPFHLQKVSYWSRTVMVPLFILCSLKAKARNPHNIDVQELFVTPPEEEKNYFKIRSVMNGFIFFLERIGFRLEPFVPDKLRNYAIKKAERWFTERLNGEDGLGAIFPAMVNAYEALDLLGYPEDHPYRKTAKKALEKLLVVREQEAYCQPCLSPIWDTLLIAGAFQEDSRMEPEVNDSLNEAAEWLIDNQLKDEPGDWREYRPGLDGGGWPFQFKNDYYPDLDDTAFAAYVLHKIDMEKYKENVLRAARWLKGMQSGNGGFAAFDADNTYYYLNEIPFADHGALLDPPTADVSARCVMLFGLLTEDHPEYREPMKQCISYLFDEQESDGSWFGRWGTNYIYGTWSVLVALEAAGIPSQHPRIRKAVKWLKKKQRPDGGWGEDNWSYHDPDTRGEGGRNTSFQTAWALLGLMAAGETESEAVQKGIEYLLTSQNEQGLWDDPEFTAPGFPKVFYLKYHGYSKYFPLWALSRYQSEMKKRPTILSPSKSHRRVGIVVALPQELKTLGVKESETQSVLHRSENILVCLSGTGPENAAKAAEKLIEKDVDIIISWGTAAALHHDIDPGSIALPRKIISGKEEVIEVDDTLRKKIADRLGLNGFLISSSLCETETLLTNSKEKFTLARNNNAAIADMESAAVARIAEKHNISFLAIRAVSDSVELAIPGSVRKNIANGSVNISGIINQTLLNPGDWIPMIKLYMSFKKARKSLNQTAETLIPYLENIKNGTKKDDF